MRSVLPVPADERAVVFKALADHTRLTAHQKAVISLHLSEPHLTKRQIADRLGASLTSVYEAFYAGPYEGIAKAVTAHEKRNLLPLAVAVLRECLNSLDDKVRLNAALRILEDSGEIKKVPTISKTDNKVMIVWQDGSPAPIRPDE